MKRSQINGLIREGEAFFASRGFALPAWASWEPRQWRGSRGHGLGDRRREPGLGHHGLWLR